MDRDKHTTGTGPRDWETPGFEEIRVSAEATAYMGIKENWD
ncbi:MAG: pyrroloquinoline quinone precursor peptide PqqA [Actinobacteria bacterium]|jgi:coenzyme PQQ precursor peptide PqqA|nr:pyrroloquinoline quinone precursor peptide PqqA [Actinomycetota bacterium]